MYGQFSQDAIVVQKYGGTSVGSLERIEKVAQRARRHRDLGRRHVAIVVSAMAGETNRLVELVRQVNPKASAKTYDLSVAAGEQVSVGLTSAALEAVGLTAEPLLAYQLGIVTDTNYSKARIQKINTERIEACWREGKIPVVAGFQGMTSDWGLTTLGRGGGDTSAVALAVALGASFCEINTDVDGVFSADPRLVKDAHLIERLPFDVALEMSSLGSKVLHSRCVELASKFSLPLVVRNTFSADDSRRTLVINLSEKERMEAPVVSGLTLDKDVSKITVEPLSDKQGGLGALFDAIAKQNVNVDIIVHDLSEGKMSVGFTVPTGEVDRALQGIESFKTAVGNFEVRAVVTSGLAKVSAVGVGMSSHSGVAARMFTALAESNVPVSMVSTSEIKISCVVALADGEKGLQAVHGRFFPRSA